MMKKLFAFLILAPLVLLSVSCHMPNGVSTATTQASPGSPQGNSSGSALTLETDASRGQAVLVTQSGAQIDISAVTDDGSTAKAAEAVGLAVVDQGTGAKSVSGSSQVIIIGTRSDGNPGAWAYSSGKIQSVIDEDSGALTSVLPASSECNGTLKGPFGWVYHVMGISEDGRIIVGYAENKKGFSWGKYQIDAGTTIGVYWRVSRHPVRPFFLVSRAHIIGTFDLSKIPGAGKASHHWANWMMKHILDQLKWFLLDYLTSYLVMVDKNGVHFDSTNKVYLVSGTDQDNDPAVATIDLKGNITITPQAPPGGVTITTVAGTGTGGFNGDNISATTAQLFLPAAVALDQSGNLYIVDSANQRVRKVTGGTITTVAGNGTAGYTGDGGGATSAELSSPSGVTIDSTGNVSIADRINNVIRRVSGGTITTVAGQGPPALAGYSGDSGSATSAKLDLPYGVAVDSSGNLYIADTINNVIRKVSGTTITTVAGNFAAGAGYSGDSGPATSAQLYWPRGVAVDSSGNLYIADSLNNVIRKVSGTTITTVAGNHASGAGYSGDNGPATSAKLNAPYGVAVDSSGNIYIADTVNNVIRKVSTGGTITTVAGNGTAGYAGDGGAPTSAELNQPQGVAVDTAGNLYIADYGNSVIRAVK